MRWALHVVSFALVVVVAFWSYRVTYGTQNLLDANADLRRDIAREREAIAVLAAEWAWLNAPERLARLAKAHEAALGLGPMTPESFAMLREIADPPIDDGMEPVALIDLDELGPQRPTSPAPRPRPVRVAPDEATLATAEATE